MHRSFAFNLPADTVAHQLYALMLLVTGAVPTDGILPDRVQSLKIAASSVNAADTITVAGSNFANTLGQPLAAGDLFERSSNRNTICLKDYYVKGSANSLGIIVDIEAV